QTARFHFCAQEVEQVIGDTLGGFVRLEQRRRNVRLAGQDNTAHLGRIDRDADATDTGADVVNRDVLAGVLTSGARHIDIVHAFVFTRSGSVQLDDYMLGGLYEDRGVAHRAGRNDLTVFGNGGRFDDRVVDLRQHALADQFCHVG